jgi:hypothetical protein
MSRKRSLKPGPRPGFNVLIATKKGAAIGQLESAILLWVLLRAGCKVAGFQTVEQPVPFRGNTPTPGGKKTFPYISYRASVQEWLAEHKAG